MHERNIKATNARELVGVSDKTLNEYGDFLQRHFPAFAGGVWRVRKYNFKEIAMMRELKYRRNLRMNESEIVAEIHAIFYESTVIVAQ
ncbi:hypothetical protein FC756_12110 [Lysinibacillus mangiferihumi]|uniref:MerR family transcriptional regulator n=1 Tax=Lysinibacillus mangiferihumi TaxID=1130819 RepID=A0A4U2Z387_9BACI|nr:hypothetical protein [Lysinibacillus mangiferihumi]TKI67920.1 hypothetical protein FC756_12110 [Lysinibacillus mangiferihumi]